MQFVLLTVSTRVLTLPDTVIPKPGPFSRRAYRRGIRANGAIHGIMDGAFGGLKESLVNAGLQAFHPNLVAALDQALSDPSLKKRWLEGDRVFQQD